MSVLIDVASNVHTQEHTGTNVAVIGSSPGLQSVRREQMEIRTLEIVNAGLHCSCTHVSSVPTVIGS